MVVVGISEATLGTSLSCLLKAFQHENEEGMVELGVGDDPNSEHIVDPML